MGENQFDGDWERELAESLTTLRQAGLVDIRQVVRYARMRGQLVSRAATAGWSGVFWVRLLALCSTEWACRFVLRVSGLWRWSEEIVDRVQFVLNLELQQSVRARRYTLAQQLEVEKTRCELYWFNYVLWRWILALMAAFAVSGLGLYLVSLGPREGLLGFLVESASPAGVYYLSIDLFLASLVVTASLVFHALRSMLRTFRVYVMVLRA
jgi:hypothetical protein